MNSDFVKNVKEMNPGKNIKLNVVGGNVMSKFKAASTANKEFIESLLFIGRDILNMISLPMCIKKLGYEFRPRWTKNLDVNVVNLSDYEGDLPTWFKPHELEKEIIDKKTRT